MPRPTSRHSRPLGGDLQNSLNQDFDARNQLNVIHQDRERDHLYCDDDRDYDLYGTYYDKFYDK